MKSRTTLTLALLTALATSAPLSTSGSDLRPSTHDEYAKTLWDSINGKAAYKNWQQASEPTAIPYGPCQLNATIYLNATAAGDSSLPYKSVVVAEHSEGDTLTGVTVWYRMKEKSDAAHDDWYFAHYLPDGTTVQTSADHEPYGKPGFVTAVRDGRLWVFRPGSADLAEFIKSGEPAKHVTLPGSGPAGMTIKGPDADLILEYMTTKPGFVTAVRDGRLWVFRPGSEPLTEFYANGEPAKHVIRPGSGPQGMTIKAPDAEIVEEYLYSKLGFVVRVVDGRLWVFREGSPAVTEFESQGEPAKHITLPGIGPGGMTIKSEDMDTALAYLAAKDGFVTEVVDGRIWVFKEGSPELAEFRKSGEPAKSVIRPAAGPGGATLKAPDAETLDAYLIAIAD